MLSKNKKIIYDYHSIIPRAQIHPYELLANAIIEQAVNDYRASRSGRVYTASEKDQLNMSQDEVDEKIMAQKKELARFFTSKWCAMLTKADTEWLFEKLRKEHHRPWKPHYKYVKVSAERLKEEIDRQNLSYNKLEQLTGVKGDYIFKIFRGKVIIPVKRLKKLAKGLGVAKSELAVKYIIRREDLL